MARPILGLLVGCLALAPAACRTSPTDERVREVQEGALMKRDLRSYDVILSAHQGKVGYLKVYDVTEAGGPAYPWTYVYDRDFLELGFLDQFSNAYMYKRYPAFEQDIHKRTLRYVRLPSDSLERNVMRMLGIDPALDDLSFAPATRADIMPPPPESAPAAEGK